jgi:hypothetical protein
MEGVQLVPYIITCYFIGRFNLWGKVTLLWSPGNIPQLQFFFVSLWHSLISPPSLYLSATIVFIKVLLNR